MTRAHSVAASVLFAAVTSVAAVPSPGAAQVRQDSVSGDYYVALGAMNGRLVELRVVSPNRVRASLDLSVDPLSDHWLRYHYVLRVLQGSEQPVDILEILCPDGDDFRNLSAFKVSGADTAAAWFADRWSRVDDEWVCAFEGPSAELAVGEMLHAALETRLLPSVSELRVFGSTPGVRWPDDSYGPGDPIFALVDSLSGMRGGWKAVVGVAPLRDPHAIADPDVGLRVLRGDLARVCGMLAWITDAGICNSLQVKLIQASRSLDRGQREAAKGQLEAFLAELDAQHGPEPGKHVSANAYWLLKVNAEYLLRRL